MDPAHQEMIAALKSIRDQADSVLKKLALAAEKKSLSWKCVACGHIKRFTRPTPAGVAAPCPRCSSIRFEHV